MRICVLARGVPDEKSPLNGIYEWSLATTLAESGYDVTVLAIDLRNGKNRKKTGLNRYEKEGVKVLDYRIPLGRANKKISIFLRKRICVKTYEKFRNNEELPDFTWIFFCRTFGPIAACLKREFGVCYVLSEYESRLLTEKIKEKDLKKIKNDYENAFVLTAPNRAFCSRMEEIVGLKFDFLPPRPPTPAERKSHGEFVFLSIGALRTDKGMDIVIRAFASVRKRMKNVRLIIVGAGEERRALGEQAVCLNVEKSVTFAVPGKDKPLESYFAESDCFVLASRKEFFGAVYLAALGAGLPVVTTKCFSPEGLIPPFCGEVVPVDDAVTFAEAMARAASHNSPYDEERIKRYAEETFSARAITKKINRFLSERRENRPAQDIE